MDEDPSAENAQGISEIYHEVLLLMIFLQTKPEVKKMNNNIYDIYYTVIKNSHEKEMINKEYEIDNIIFSDFVPNRYFGRKNDQEILRWSCLRSQINQFSWFLPYKWYWTTRKKNFHESENEKLKKELEWMIKWNHY